MRYQFFKCWVKIAIRLFFKNIQITGSENIPKNSPVIFALNHQNSLLDALVMAVSVKQPVYFMTRADIFKKKRIASFLKSIHLIPIYRIRDGYSAIVQNEEIFDYCIQLLSKNKHILIFPEGSHDYRRHLRPLKKGIARMAVEATIQLKKEVSIIPVGINYGSHRHSQSWLNIQIGAPISTQNALEIFDFHLAKTENWLISILEPALKKNMIHFDHKENIREENDILKLSTNHLHIKKTKLFDFQQKFALKFNQINETERIIYYQQINEYRLLFIKHHLDLKMMGKINKGEPIILLLFALILAPLILLSKLIFVPTWLGFRYLLKQFKDKQWEASVKVISIMVIYPIWIAILLILSWVTFPHIQQFVCAFIAIMVLGMANKLLSNQLRSLIFKLKKMYLKISHKIDYKNLCTLEQSIFTSFNTNKR